MRMDFLSSLRNKTGAAHQALHHHPSFMKLDSGENVNNDYLLNVYSKLYYFHSTLETRALVSSYGSFYTENSTPILDNLRHDISLLGGSIEETKVHNFCQLEMNDFESIWAYLYFKEGSLIGGQVIQKTLTKNFELYDQRLRHFSGLKKHTSKNWKNFINTMLKSTEDLDQDLIISNTNKLFSDLHNWLDV